jgi:hypothetical protein
MDRGIIDRWLENAGGIVTGNGGDGEVNLQILRIIWLGGAQSRNVDERLPEVIMVGDRRRYIDWCGTRRRNTLCGLPVMGLARDPLAALSAFLPVLGCPFRKIRFRVVWFVLVHALSVSDEHRIVPEAATTFWTSVLR